MIGVFTFQAGAETLKHLKGQSGEKKVAFKCSFFREDNNATIYLGVKQMLTELLQPEVETIWCIYAI